MPSEVEIIKHSHLSDYHPLTISHIPSDPNFFLITTTTTTITAIIITTIIIQIIK